MLCAAPWLAAIGQSRNHSILGIRRQVLLHPVCPCHRFRQEIHRQEQTLVRFRAAKAQETLAGGAETLAAQASDAEALVRSLQQVHRQAVGLDAQAPANGRHVGKT